MGVYDMVLIYTDKGDVIAQVKCWSRTMREYKIGDKVPNVDGEHNYIIALREGGYLYVFHNTLIEYSKGLLNDEVANFPVFDKYGDPYSEESAGIFGEPYTKT